jgi:hypothetical protein
VFEILGGRKSFFQWDLNQKLIVFDDSITEVHFCNKSDDCALVCEVVNYENDLSVVAVPNILLQACRDIRVYGVAEDHTEHYARFEVISRSKPADYVYTETECKTFDLLEQRMQELEDSFTTEGIAEAVAEYLEVNPVEAGATAEEKAQIEQNAADIKELQESGKENCKVYITKVTINNDADLTWSFADTFEELQERLLNGETIIACCASIFYSNLVMFEKDSVITFETMLDNTAFTLSLMADNTTQFNEDQFVNSNFVLDSMPTRVSQLANDANYTTEAKVNSIIEEAISGIEIPEGGGSSSEWTKLRQEFTIDGGTEGKTGRYQLAPELPISTDFTEAFVTAYVTNNTSVTDHRINCSSKLHNYITGASATPKGNSRLCYHAIRFNDYIVISSLDDKNSHIYLEISTNASGSIGFWLHWATIGAGESFSSIGEIMYR